MSTTNLQQFFLWCTVINYGLLILWWVIFSLKHEWIYVLAGKRFKMSPETFDAHNLVGIIFYKICIILFCLVPYIALRIVG